jgi:tetratricopeptide (TPR) repeat protein
MRASLLSRVVCAALVGLAVPEALAQESRLDALRTAARTPGEAWRASVALGRGLRIAGRVAEAETELHRAVALAGSAPEPSAAALGELARVYMDRRDFGQALGTCQRLAKVRGAEARGHACIAEAHLVWQRASLALTEVATALAKDPSCYEAKIAEGRAHDVELDSAGAEASLREAIGMRADDAGPHRLLGRVLVGEGKNDDGIAELRKAVSLDGADPDALFDLATALGPGAESAALLERATRERVPFARAWIALGRQQIATGSIAKAKASVQAAARVDPGGADVRVLEGQIALAEGRVDDAIRAGQAVLKLVPNSAPGQLLVADGNARKGEIDAALEAYQASWGFDHREPAALVHASEACHAAGRDTSARAFGVKATQEFPDWAPGWAALGDALAGQNERQASRDAYAKALGAKGGSIDRDSVQRKLVALR